MCSILAEDPRWSSKAWEQLSVRVDALAKGEPMRLHGYEMPDGHWAREFDERLDWLLGSDDVLRLDK